MYRVNCAVCKEPIREIGTALNGKPVHIYCYHAAQTPNPPTMEDIDFVLEQTQYGYESHLDWEQYFRTHRCSGDDCKACEEAKLLGDADFHATQKRRYEVELRILRWVKGELNERIQSLSKSNASPVERKVGAS